jgi:D-inositol-3-phosphate glycosyltransferase
MAHALDRFVRHHRLSYDLVHSHYWISGCVGDTVSRKWGCPHLVTFHTLGLVKNRTTEGEAEPDVRITHERRLVAAATAVVVPSAGEHRHLLDHYGADAEKVQIIPCGVNLVQFRPADKGQARRALHLDPDAAILLFVGRFAPVKGIPSLLQAVAEVAQRQAFIKLVVVGGDGEAAETTQEVRRRAEELGITARLQMAGRIDHGRLPLFYSAADLLVLPSTYESFGLVTLESLACGTPVVATRVGGAAAIIEEGVNGALIDGSDRGVLADGIERVLARVRGGRLSVRRVRQSVAPYSWKHVASAIVSVYKDVLRCRNA